MHAVTLSDPGGLAQSLGVADHHCERHGDLVDSRFTIDPDDLNTVVGILHQAGIHTLTVTPPSLDALFLQNFGDTHDPHADARDRNLVKRSR